MRSFWCVYFDCYDNIITGSAEMQGRKTAPARERASERRERAADRRERAAERRLRA